MKTNFDEDYTPEDELKAKIKEALTPSKSAMLAFRSYQLLNATEPELERMIMDMELGRQVRTHFNTSQTQVLLRSDISQELLKL